MHARLLRGCLSPGTDSTVGPIHSHAADDFYTLPIACFFANRPTLRFRRNSQPAHRGEQDIRRCSRSRERAIACHSEPFKWTERTVAGREARQVERRRRQRLRRLVLGIVCALVLAYSQVKEMHTAPLRPSNAPLGQVGARKCMPGSCTLCPG